MPRHMICMPHEGRGRGYPSVEKKGVGNASVLDSPEHSRTFSWQSSLPNESEQNLECRRSTVNTTEATKNLPKKDLSKHMPNTTGAHGQASRILSSTSCT